MTNINNRTVQQFLKRARERSSIENKSGGKKKSTPQDDPSSIQTGERK
jgi:hypothetical protein